MPIQNFYAAPAWPAVVGGQQSWSYDIEMPPSTVLASTSLQTFTFSIWTSEGTSPSGAQGFGVWSGISSYTRKGVPNAVGFGQPYGVVPFIYAQDVETVTFRYGVAAQDLQGGVVNQARAYMTLQVWIWG
jgi:hypothetical protein